jgi:molybdate transport system ATP-binding protein
MSLQVQAQARRGDFVLDADFSSDARFLALFGRSGAGKSTLADVIAGLLRPQRGRVILGGEPLFDAQARVNLPAWRRRIGYVFQEPRLFPHLNVRRNLLYGREGGPANVGEPTLRAVSDLLGLDALLDRRPRMLSGGEARRVAIGRALLSGPRLLILDEPLAGLDGALRAELLPYLEGLKRRGGVPMIYVSHSVEEVTRLADEIVLLSGGRTLACGAPSVVFDHPEAEAAAALDAPLSVLDGTVAGHDGGGATRVTIGSQIFLAPRLALAEGDPVRIVIDARDVALALSNPTDVSIQNRLALRIAGLEPRPGGVVVRLEAPGVVLKSLVTPAAVEQLALAPGKDVFALVKATAAARYA